MRYLPVVCVLAIFLSVRPLLLAGQRSRAPAKPATSAAPFDPHDLTGTWTGDSLGDNDRAIPLGRRPRRAHFSNGSFYDQRIPEPQLTSWAKEHLMMKSISHNALGATGTDFDVNGVPTNDPNGEFPGKECDPLGAPALYDFPTLSTYEFFTTPGGDRIFQLISYHREWRVFHLNQEHSKDLAPTYEGDSVAKWEGDTLVVDTVGFNGRTQINQNVTHWKSDEFRLVERFTRTSHDFLELDMTLYDPKAWGDKSWPGFKRYFKLVPTEDFEEFVCSAREYRSYNNHIFETFNKQDAAPKDAPKK